MAQKEAQREDSKQSICKIIHPNYNAEQQFTAFWTMTAVFI